MDKLLAKDLKLVIFLNLPKFSCKLTYLATIFSADRKTDFRSNGEFLEKVKTWYFSPVNNFKNQRICTSMIFMLSKYVNSVV